MATGLLEPAVDHLQRIAAHQGGRSDGELLRCFVARRDEASFGMLVRRYGPMVLGVCKRVLNHHHDAEDAFQATFLVLARKAEYVDPAEQVGNWLYGVAYRIAQKARTAGARRRAKERQAPPRDAADGTGVEGNWEIRRVIDQELDRLPEKYRAAVVLCDLQGRPRKEAARQLGCPEGTLSSRLAAARDLLAARLTRRGLALSAAGVVATLASSASAAAVPPSLSAATVKAAAGVGGVITTNVAFLAEGVFNMMPSKFIPAICAALLAIVGGATAFALAGPTTNDSTPLTRSFSSAIADKEKKPRGESLRATVVSVDAAKKTITLAIPTNEKDKKNVTEKTIAVDADAKVILADILTKTETPPTGKLADLSAGTGVDAELSVDGKSVVAIVAHGPGLHGTIKSVDAEKNTITVTGKNKDGATEHTLTLIKGARVLLNDGLAKGTPDKESKLSDLAEGTRVNVQLTVDRRSAMAIRVEGQAYHGTLKALDNGNSTITITVKEDGQVVDKTFKLLKGARTEGNLTPGAQVDVSLSVIEKDAATFVRARE